MKHRKIKVTPKLLPCPFCGGPASVGPFRFEPGSFRVGCISTCAADPTMCAIQPEGLAMTSESAAIAAWNHRAKP